jgi:beta-glucosidase
VELAGRSDLVVLVVGELANMSGELASQSSLDLPGRQVELVKAVAATGRPVALVLVNGRPLNLSQVVEHMPAILEVWHPGVEGGNAVADLLWGDMTPGGKLTVPAQRRAVSHLLCLTSRINRYITHVHVAVLGYAASAVSIRLGLSYTTFAY